MSNQFVLPYKEGLDRTLALYEKFLRICPEEVWNEKFGGWYVSQQLYHAIGASSTFAATFTGEPITGYQQEAGQLTRGNEITPTMQQAQQLLEAVNLALQKTFEILKDDDLLKLNPRACKGMGREITNARVLGLLDGHMLYHLGTCDAALRQRGMEGAF